MSERRWVMVSFSEAEGAAFARNGPRRDLAEVAAASGATIAYREGRAGRGALSRIAGPHVRQAWRLARTLRRGDQVLADGEHTGVPLLLFAALRWRRPGGVVVIGHLVSKPWKLFALAVATRLGITGTLVLHSVEQERRARGWLGRGWRTRLVPYQVDTAFWTAADDDDSATPGSRPLVVAVGAENRDYETLFRAADGLDVDVVVAAGSHWARGAAGIDATLPGNVRFLADALPFAKLRDLYRRASLVVVPLREVPNQSGVTVILEAMSCGRPVVVTATNGQRECIEGPLVTANAGKEGRPLPGRGPGTLLGGDAHRPGVSGLYVNPGDDRGLRRAIGLLVDDPALRTELGRNARASAVANFSIERFVSRMGGVLAGSGRGV